MEKESPSIVYVQYALNQINQIKSINRSIKTVKTVLKFFLQKLQIVLS